MKFARLRRRLNLSKWEAVGLLESMWLMTQVSAPSGDIGRFANEDIAAWLEWSGDADELVNCLTECGWLDPHPVHRLVVHDWKEHAPNHVKGAMAKHGKQFAEDTPATCLAGCLAGCLAQSQAECFARASREPNLTKPNLTSLSPDLSHPPAPEERPNQNQREIQSQPETGTIRPESIQVLVDEWKRLELPGHRTLTITSSIRGHWQQRLHDDTFRERWREAVSRIRGSPWLMGTDDNAKWAGLTLPDFLRQPKWFEEIMNGKWEVKKPPPPAMDFPNGYVEREIKNLPRWEDRKKRQEAAT